LKEGEAGVALSELTRKHTRGSSLRPWFEEGTRRGATYRLAVDD